MLLSKAGIVFGEEVLLYAHALLPFWVPARIYMTGDLYPIDVEFQDWQDSEFSHQRPRSKKVIKSEILTCMMHFVMVKRVEYFGAIDLIVYFLGMLYVEITNKLLSIVFYPK